MKWEIHKVDNFAENGIKAIAKFEVILFFRAGRFTITIKANSLSFLGGGINFGHSFLSCVQLNNCFWFAGREGSYFTYLSEDRKVTSSPSGKIRYNHKLKHYAY